MPHPAAPPADRTALRCLLPGDPARPARAYPCPRGSSGSARLGDLRESYLRRVHATTYGILTPSRERPERSFDDEMTSE